VFLTRFTVNPRLHGAWSLLSHPQRLHAAVLGSFPEGAQTTEGRVLWRLDNDTPHRPILWILSPFTPGAGNLIQQAGWPDVPAERQWLTKPYAPLLNRLATGQRYAFRLTANPTRSINDEQAAKKDGRTRGRRVGHTTVHHQIRWLVDKSSRAGFRILPSSQTLPGTDEPALDLQLTGRDNAMFGKHDQTARQRHTVTITRASYLGGLEVTDVDTFRATLVRGIGRSRAYGCGLLTLATNNSQ
jgi:CRISPR system Cascade subunit CasE